jgi:hypothetical protein
VNRTRTHPVAIRPTSRSHPRSCDPMLRQPREVPTSISPCRDLHFPRTEVFAQEASCHSGGEFSRITCMSRTAAPPSTLCYAPSKRSEREGAGKLEGEVSDPQQAARGVVSATPGVTVRVWESVRQHHAQSRCRRFGIANSARLRRRNEGDRLLKSEPPQLSRGGSCYGFTRWNRHCTTPF